MVPASQPEYIRVMRMSTTVAYTVREYDVPVEEYLRNKEMYDRQTFEARSFLTIGAEAYVTSKTFAAAFCKARNNVQAGNDQTANDLLQFVVDLAKKNGLTIPESTTSVLTHLNKVIQLILQDSNFADQTVSWRMTIATMNLSLWVSMDCELPVVD